MSTLHDQLHALALEADAAEPTASPRATYGRGRRRARRDRAVTLVSTLLVAVVAVALLWPGEGTQALRPARPVGPGEALSLPQRFTKPWLARDLPTAPGRAAAVVQEPPTLEPGWLVMPDGRVWRVPPEPAASDVWVLGLSPDGRWLTRLDEQYRLALHDLVTGDRRTVDLAAVGMQSWSGSARVLWTRDSSRILVADSDFSGNTFTVDPVGAVVDPATGAATRVPGRYPAGLAEDVVAGMRVAGWQDESTVLALLPQRDGEPGGTLLRWRPGDAAWADTGVRVPSNTVPTGAGQGWRSVGLAPDGRALYSLVTMPEPAVLHVVDPATGTERRRLPVPDPASWSWLGWRGDRPVYRRSASPDTTPGPVAPEGVTAAPFVLDPRFRPWDLQVAQAALDGPVHTQLGGTSTSWVSWHWRETLAALGIARAAPPAPAVAAATGILTPHGGTGHPHGAGARRRGRRGAQPAGARAERHGERGHPLRRLGRQHPRRRGPLGGGVRPRRRRRDRAQCRARPLRARRRGSRDLEPARGRRRHGRLLRHGRAVGGADLRHDPRRGAPDHHREPGDERAGGR